MYMYMYIVACSISCYGYSTEDACSYPTTSDLEEYVLNTSGKIWVGSASSNYGRPWQFSQFNDNCLVVISGSWRR